MEMVKDKPKDDSKHLEVPLIPGYKIIERKDTNKGYAIIFMEPDTGFRLRGPVGKGSEVFDNIGEKITTDMYNILDAGVDKELPIIRNRQFDSCRNSEILIKALQNPEETGIVSGRKPSGPCHFGHALLVNTLAILQKNGSSIYVPVADLEVMLDKKVSNKTHGKMLAADNLLDWGALGLNLDKAHVYLQSEEIRVMNFAYMASRNILFEDGIDIYGAETMANEFNFVFAGLAQVGDILLPQHKDFGKKYSVMVSGTDQDGHMSMTTTLSKMLASEGTINNPPASLYIRTITSLSDKKESASEPTVTLYLGSMRNVYNYTSDGKRESLKEIKLLNLDERIADTYAKVDKFSAEDIEKVISAIKRRTTVFKELEDLDPENLDEFKTRTKNMLIKHEARRREVYAYALRLALNDYEADKTANKEKIEKIHRLLEENGSMTQGRAPEFWDYSERGAVPKDLHRIRTKWYEQIAEVADLIMP